MRRVLLFFAFLLIFPPVRSAWAQTNLYLSPMLVQINLAPGAKKEFVLLLTNEDKEKSLSLRCYTMDMEETRSGAYKVLDKGKSEYSCADWMEPAESFFTIQPGKSKELKVKITVPRNVVGGRYGAVVFEPVPEKEKKSTEEEFAAVVYRFRMPAFVELTIKRFGGRKIRLKIADFNLKTVSGGNLAKRLGKEALRFTAAVVNEGNIHVEGRGKLIIRTKEGRTKRRVPLAGGRGVVLPGATVNFISVLRKLPPGEYIARAMISYERLSPLVAELPFSVEKAKTSATDSFQASEFLSLDIKPESIERKAPSGGFRTFSVSLRNGESESLYVEAYLRDIKYDEEGELVVLDSAGGNRSCARWIEFKPKSRTLKPRGGASFKFNVEVPPEVSGGYYACIVLEASRLGTKESSIHTPFQVPVFITVPLDLEKKGEILDLKIAASANTPSSFAVYFNNTGNVHFKPTGRIILSMLKQVKMVDDFIYVGKPEYEPLAELGFKQVENYVLPGGTLRMQANYTSELEAGKYQAEVIVSYLGETLAKTEKRFVIK